MLALAAFSILEVKTMANGRLMGLPSSGEMILRTTVLKPSRMYKFLDDDNDRILCVRRGDYIIALGRNTVPSKDGRYYVFSVFLPYKDEDREWGRPVYDPQYVLPEAYVERYKTPRGAWRKFRQQYHSAR